MKRRIRVTGHRLCLVAVGMGIPLAGCKRQEAAAKDLSSASSGHAATQTVGQGTPARASEVDAQPANPDPCALVPIEDAKRLMGPFSGAPYRGVSGDDASPSDDGHACIYPLVPREKVAEGSVIALELQTTNATGFENGATVVAGMAKGLLNWLGAKSVDGAQRSKSPRWESVDGWDYIGGYTDIMTARVGHIAIYAKWTRARGAADSLVEVMDIMRDHIPDRPFLSSERESSEVEGDPCSLVTTEEVEQATGKLLFPPYRSHNLSGLADPRGNACSYYTANHHVLSMMPSWSHGKQLFRVLASLSQNVESKLGNKGAEMDTLAGDWDQRAISVTGDILLLKGDRLLQISHRTSTAAQPEATHLGSQALKRLAAAP